MALDTGLSENRENMFLEIREIGRWLSVRRRERLLFRQQC